MSRSGSLEDLALVELAALVVPAGPREVVVDQLLGLLAGGVQLLPVVRLVVYLPVGREREGQLVAAPDPHAGDAGVVVCAEQAHGCERLLAHLVQPLEHACANRKPHLTLTLASFDMDLTKQQVKYRPLSPRKRKELIKLGHYNNKYFGHQTRRHLVLN